MDNSRFSSLLFRIIGTPERWHHDYIEVMNQILDEKKTFGSPSTFSELTACDEILDRLTDSNQALFALNTLLNNSRFKMIILDETFKVVYHNRSADELRPLTVDASPDIKIKPPLLANIRTAAEKFKSQSGVSSELVKTESVNNVNEDLYLRSIKNQTNAPYSTSLFHILLAIDQNSRIKGLNKDLIQHYALTGKEQKILASLTNGSGVKEISSTYFVSENTVRTHLKSLFRKTNTNSQTDIVRLVLTHESRLLDSYFESTLPSLSKQAHESTLNKFVTLNNGFKIAYREYGPSNGNPIIVCHHAYGSRVTICADYEKICHRNNKRMIIPDRPGFGLTPTIKGHPEQWHGMLSEFIDILKLETYELLGTVLGSVIAINYALQADKRLTRLRLASPIYVNNPKDSQFLTGILSPVSRSIRTSRRLTIKLYKLWLKSIGLNLASYYRTMVENELGHQERHLFSRNNSIDLIIESFQKGCSKCLDGMSHEMVHCVSPQKADLSKIHIPVDLWWGCQDNRISLSGVKNLASQLPNARLHIREGYSEYIYFALFEQIISD